MAFKLKSPFNNGSSKSKTPEVDKFMKMNERSRKKPTIAEKANYAMEGIMNTMTVPLTGKTVEARRKKYQSEEADKKERAEARKSISPVNAYMDDADTSKLKQAQHSSSYTGPKNMITADGVNTQLTQDDKITTVGGDDPFSGYSKDAFKKKNEDDTPVPTDAEMKNTFDQFIFDNKEELDKLEQDIQNRKKPLYPSEKVQKRRTTSMRNPKDQLVDVDKYRKQAREKEKREQAYQATPGPSFEPKEYDNNPPFMMKKKQLTKTGAGKAHNMSALQYNQEQLMSNLSGAGDQPSQADLDAMKALLSLQNSEGMSSSPMNMKSYSEQRTRMMDNFNQGIQDLGDGMQGSPMNQNGGPGDGRKKPTANIMKSESTSVASPQAWEHEQIKTDAITDHVFGMRDMGFYSDEYAKNRISGKMGYPASTHEAVRHPAADSTAVEKTIAKGPKKQGLKTTQVKNTSVGGKRIKALKKGSPAKNDVRKMKRAAKKEDKAKMKAKRKAGTLDSSDFAHQPYRTLKGKF